MESTHQTRVPANAEKITVLVGAVLWLMTPEGRRVGVGPTAAGAACRLFRPEVAARSDETPEQALDRLIRRMTGSRPQGSTFAGWIESRQDPAHAVMVFNVLVGHDCLEIPNVAWFSHQAARKHLPEAERRLLDAWPRREDSGGWLGWRGWRNVGSRDRSRLAGSLAAYGGELERRFHGVGDGGPTPAWTIAARQLLADAQAALDAGKLDEGWKCFHAAQRMEVYGMPLDQLRARARLLREEANKIDSWRKKAIQASLDALDTAPTPSTTQTRGAKLRAVPPKRTSKYAGKVAVSNQGQVAHDTGGSRAERSTNGQPASKDESLANLVYEALLLRDEHFNNQYYKIHLVQRQLQLLLIAATALVGLVLALAWRGFLGPDVQWQTLVVVVLFGALGASIGAVFSISKLSPSARIPEQKLHGLISILRPVLGGAVALGVYFFALADVLSLVEIAMTNLYAVIVVSFIAGFSERLIIRVVENVAGGAQA